MSDEARPLVGLDADSLQALVESVVATAAEKIYQAQGKEGLSVSRAWIYQRPEQVRDKGEADAPWYVGWIDPDGERRSKSCGAGTDGKRLAQKLRRQTEAELVTGTYGQRGNVPWEDFRKEYREKVLARLAPRTVVEAEAALDHFTRIVAPKRVGSVKTTDIDLFAAKRRQEPSRKRPGFRMAPATVNKELRHVKAALHKARRWKYLAAVPDFDMEREPRHLPVFLTPEHFAAVYRVCDQARRPACQGYTAGDWWRGLLVTVYLTGWRIGAVLALRRADVDLDKGEALTRAEDTKGGRDQLVPLHPVVVAHLKRLPGFTAELLPWPRSRRQLLTDWHRLCDLAGVPRYGFHAAKRAFCTLNAPVLDAGTLQYLAQHASFGTTQAYYINPTARVAEAVSRLFVPDILKRVD